MARILVYGLNYAPELTGVGRYTGDLCAFLAEGGHEVRVLTAPPHYPAWRVDAPFRADRYSRVREGAVEVLRCPLVVRENARGLRRLLAPLSFAASSAPLALWTAIRWRPDVVLCIEPTLTIAPAGLLAARLARARAVLHVQDLEVDAAFAVGHLRGGRVRQVALALERLLLSGFDRVVTISERMRERILAKGVPAARLALVRNWVDLRQIRPLAAPSSYREELGLPDDSFVALYAGSIGAKQSLETVLEAAEALATDGNVHFVIAGEGPAKPDLVARWGGLPNVRFLPLQPEERLCDLLNLADVHLLPQGSGVADLVLPSKLGGMLASGRPLIVTADPGTELHDFLLGAACLVPSGSSAAVAAELRRMRGAGRVLNEAGRAKAGLLSRDDCLPRFEGVLVGRAN